MEEQAAGELQRRGEEREGGHRRHAAMAATAVRGSPVRSLARSLMRGLTPQSRVHPSGAEAVKTLDFWAAERPSLLPVAQV